MRYRDFPKGDARRYFVVLAALDALPVKEATIHHIATRIGSTRAEVQRALQALAGQFGVVFERAGSAYVVMSWGALDKNAILALASHPCAAAAPT